MLCATDVASIEEENDIVKQIHSALKLKNVASVS